MARTTTKLLDTIVEDKELFFKIFYRGRIFPILGKF